MTHFPVKPTAKSVPCSIHKIWIFACVLILILVLAAALDLTMSYNESVKSAYEKADLSSHLVSEWISESLHNIRYILRDISQQVEMSPDLKALQASTFSDPFNQLLLNRAQADDHLLILGVNRADGHLAYSSIPAILGKSAKDLQREYLKKATEEPLDAFKIGNAFVSSTGALNVTATYPVFSSSKDFLGFSMAGIDLSFFQRWLDRIQDPSVTITIIDSRQKILARKPVSDYIGKVVEIESLPEFIGNQKARENLRFVSPLDSADRLWSIRKIADLPFLVAVGYSAEEALADWSKKLLIYILAVLFLCIIIIEFVKKYIVNKQLVEDLQGALSEVKTLSGLIPICAQCKSIRDDKGYWNQIESYIHEHSEAQFSHSICPDCRKALYTEFNEDSD